MSRPHPAPVRPRVISPHTGETLLLEDWVEPFLRNQESGAICVYGPPGSGKSTALAHLAARFPRPAVVVFLDEPGPAEVEELHDHVTVVYTARKPHALSHLALGALASWDEDERLEYLMAAHRERCGSVMERVRTALEKEDPPESAELWRIALDAMAADESVRCFSDALRRHLDGRFGWRQRRHARCFSLRSMSGPWGLADERSGLMAFPGCLGWVSPRLDSDQRRLLRYPRIQILLAAEQLARELRSRRRLHCLETPLPESLVRETGRQLRMDPKALQRLRRRLAGPESAHAMVASLLHASGTVWRPECPGTRILKGGFLPRVDWHGLKIIGLNCEAADLTGAILPEAEIAWFWAVRALLRTARLVDSRLQEFVAREADLTGADLTRVRAPGALFENAILAGANLEWASMPKASFVSADLSRARFTCADLTGANLLEAKIEDADFSSAILEKAHLPGLDLRPAVWAGVGFSGADLRSCNLERMQFPGGLFGEADLSGALLTGSYMPGVSFAGANLCFAKLGDVEWEKADLRRADLRSSTFHMGSSRSGLVFNAPPLEGSRSGFYTDEYHDQHYRAPEEIRKANLRGADLRGAKIDDVDFYLVDLRDAKYTPDQERHFRRCGAILSVRV